MKLFIIHGWTYTLGKWDELVANLNDDFEVVMLKVPGLSQPSEKVWDVPAYVDWLNQQLADEDKPAVIGHSNGGRIALAYAQAYPDKLSKLILIDSAGIPRQSGGVSLKRKILKPIAKALKPVVKGRARRGLYRLIGAHDYGNAPPNMRATMQNMLNFDKELDFSAVSVPTVIIWGEADTATPLSDGLALAKKLQAASEPIIIKGAGHSPHASHSAEVAAIIRQTMKDDE